VAAFGPLDWGEVVVGEDVGDAKAAAAPRSTMPTASAPPRRHADRAWSEVIGIELSREHAEWG
jgi:hypothetical protein